MLAACRNTRSSLPFFILFVEALLLFFFYLFASWSPTDPPLPYFFFLRVFLCGAAPLWLHMAEYDAVAEEDQWGRLRCTSISRRPRRAGVEGEKKKVYSLNLCAFS